MTNAQIRSAYKKVYTGKGSTQEWWDLLETLTPEQKEQAGEIISKLVDADRRLSSYKISPRFKNKIRKYVSERLYTDVKAYEVVKVISDKIVEIRELKATPITTPQQFVPGGFVGTYLDNTNQTYHFESDTTNPIKRLHLSNRGWGKGRFVMRDTPYKFHDYNF